ncbi:MAG: hypothetical protein AAGJ97_12620, partial [Planctomycetota bacterium]
ALKRGDRDAAYANFLAAHEAGPQTLDAFRRSELSNYLRELKPRGDVRTVGALEPLAYGEGSRTGAAAGRETARLDRLKTEVLNAIFRAERLRETNPDEAIAVLDRTDATVAASAINDELKSPLLRQLDRTREKVTAYADRMQPLIDLKRNNEEVLATIKVEREAQARRESELARMTGEFNDLMKQRRFAEADALAREARELDPENPAVTLMVTKAQVAWAIARGEDADRLKADYFSNALDDVDMSIGTYTDSILYPDIEDWQDIVRRRKYSPDNKVRTEAEEQINRSMTRQVSLDFENAPLKSVIDHLALLADSNIVIDQVGLADAGVTTDTPVSINVEGIQLKSALNIILRPLQLGTMVEDEVLKVTSRQRQEGRLVTVTYPVADLVIPIENFTNPGNMAPMTPEQFNPGVNFSVPSFGQPQTTVGLPAFGQIGDPLAGTGYAERAGRPETVGRSEADFKGLSELITNTIAPESWAAIGGNGDLQPFDTTLSLVIRQTETVHEEIRDLLQQLRRLQDLQVTVEVRFISVADDFFEQIGVDFDFDIQDTLGGPTDGDFGDFQPG